MVGESDGRRVGEGVVGVEVSGAAQRDDSHTLIMVWRMGGCSYLTVAARV
jgi:hypothetical protein